MVIHKKNGVQKTDRKLFGPFQGISGLLIAGNPYW